MIAGILAERAHRHPDREFLLYSQGALGFGACRREVEQLAESLRPHSGRSVGLAGTSPQWLAPRLLALDALGARSHLLPTGAFAARGEELSTDFRLHAILGESATVAASPDTASAPEAPGEVVIYTSGTTGVPKAALHTWASLTSRVPVRSDLEGSRWLLTYGFSTFAGLQVFLHALLNGGALVVAEGDPTRVGRLARDARITHVSGTPSFYRFLLAAASPADLAALSLRQITLGGEPPDQNLLDALSGRFPATRITQLYASTELGVCFSVNDGRAGFPADYLDNEAVGVRLSIAEGELLIASPVVMRGYMEAQGIRQPAPIFPTGDLVELRGDRVVFLGRRGERINIGGHKVFPREIEAAVLEVPGVLAARVSGARSSLLGEIVRAEIVLYADVEASEARRRILAHCRTRLRPHLVPRLVEFVKEISHTPSRKLVRN